MGSPAITPGSPEPKDVARSCGALTGIHINDAYGLFNREGVTMPNPNLNQFSFVAGGAVSGGATMRVWRESTTAEVRFVPMPRRQAARLYHAARYFERSTRSGFGAQDGRLGRNGLLVLHALLFDFLNVRTGRCDPSYAAIARAACCSVSSVYRGLVKLKRAGVLHWVRRCAGRMIDDRFVLEQETNAYGVQSEGAWQGYTARPIAKPEPGTWGAPEPVLNALEAAAAAAKGKEGAGAIQRALELEPDDKLALLLARLGRTRKPER